MKKSLLFIVLIFACLEPTTSFQRRILNGRDVKGNDFPYTVNIRGPEMHCGGSLLNDEFVLTAAHCLKDSEGNRTVQSVSVILGSKSFYAFEDDEPEMVRMKSNIFLIHENFSLPSAQDDIAIIKLPSKIKFNDKIRPVSISTDKEVDQHGNEVLGVISGWGEMDLHEPADVLQTAEMKLIPICECFMFQKDYVERITHSHICAKGLSNKSGVVGPCSGDSGETFNWSTKTTASNQSSILLYIGSSLVLRETNELIGITSFVKDAEDGEPLEYNDCDDGSAPAVYVRVAAYLDWISERTGIQFDWYKAYVNHFVDIQFISLFYHLLYLIKMHVMHVDAPDE